MSCAVGTCVRSGSRHAMLARLDAGAGLPSGARTPVLGEMLAGGAARRRRSSAHAPAVAGVAHRRKEVAA